MHQPTFLAVFLLIVLSIENASSATKTENSLIRLVRAATAKKQDCRYEKEAWEECDSSSGLQRRALKLKSGNARQDSVQCEALKYITRPCKKACKYVKGNWGECVNGMRARTDQLRNIGSGCEETRTITRKCKTACRYAKSDWSVCENGLKTKTLTLSEGDGDCEATKTISKQCAAEETKQRTKPINKQRARKKPQTSDE